MSDKRHLRRMKTIQDLFSYFYAHSDKSISSSYVKAIIDHAPKLDGYINEFARTHGADDLSKIDLSILRLSVYEMLIENKTPPKVVINEAVELAKEFGGDSSPSFINAVLGGLYNKYKHHEK